MNSLIWTIIDLCKSPELLNCRICMCIFNFTSYSKLFSSEVGLTSHQLPPFREQRSSLCIISTSSISRPWTTPVPQQTSHSAWGHHPFRFVSACNVILWSWTDSEKHSNVLMSMTLEKMWLSFRFCACLTGQPGMRISWPLSPPHSPFPRDGGWGRKIITAGGSGGLPKLAKWTGRGIREMVTAPFTFRKTRGLQRTVWSWCLCLSLQGF